MVKRPGVLSKVQMLNLVLGVGVFSLLPKTTGNPRDTGRRLFVLPGVTFCDRRKRVPRGLEKHPRLEEATKQVSSM